MYRHIINSTKKLSHINPEIQGHFSEHLGRCIYGGVYVGENSDIPNVNGMRTDVVEALKEMTASAHMSSWNSVVNLVVRHTLMAMSEAALSER